MIGSCRWLGRCHLKMGLCPPHLVLLIGPAQRGLSESSEPFRVTVPKRLSFFFHSTCETLQIRNYTYWGHRSSYPGRLQVLHPYHFSLQRILMTFRTQPLNSWHQSKAGSRAKLTQRWCSNKQSLLGTSLSGLNILPLFPIFVFRANLFHSHFLIHYFTAKGNWILFLEILVFLKAPLIN